VVTVNVSAIALDFGLGTRTMPLVNAPILGAFAKVSKLIDVGSLLQALPHFIPSNLEGNKQALQKAYDLASE
jgi:pyruvate ferredoxin oxidoreductase gamma subunit/2-oxoisovalerate ferredoxin oxidoreductase gamma subunit